MFIAFEGIDGSGKSTQARRLAETLRRGGAEVVLTREPGGSPGAEDIRRLLVEGEPARWSVVTELLLFNAARRDHLERLILPALDRGAHVVTDRFADSTRVYQGMTRGPHGEIADALHRLVIGRDPDLTILIDMDPALALARARGRRDEEARFEEFGLAFQVTLREGFLALAAREAHRIVVVDGAGAPEDVAARVAAHVLASPPAP